MFVVDVAYERDVLDLSFVSPGIDFSSESGGWYSHYLRTSPWFELIIGPERSKAVSGSVTFDSLELQQQEQQKKKNAMMKKAIPPTRTLNSVGDNIYVVIIWFIIY